MGISPEQLEVYQQFTPDLVKHWEEEVERNPNAKWADLTIKDLLPFVRTVMPRIGRNQSFFGLSIVSLSLQSLDERYEDDDKILQYGLEPLLNAGILTEGEAVEISTWFSQIGKEEIINFKKEFEVEKTRYRLTTDFYGGSRDLNLQIVKDDDKEDPLFSTN